MTEDTSALQTAHGAGPGSPSLAHLVFRPVLTAAVMSGNQALALCGAPWDPRTDARQTPPCPACNDVLVTGGAEVDQTPAREPEAAPAVMPTPTERQERALAELVERARAHGIAVRAHNLEISYRPETRPGRGHDLFVFASDGERMATAHIDVYGNGDRPAIHDIDLKCFPELETTCDLPACNDDDD